jgi:uncharacterized protein (TIGR00369 family)
MTYEPRNLNYKQTIISKFEKNVFSHHIGFNLTRIEPGLVEGELDIKEMHQQQNGMIHGGVTSTVADIVMGFAAYSLVEEGQGTVTSDLKVAYLRPGKGNKLIARGKVIKSGNLLYYCEADVICTDELGTEILIARGYSTMCAIKPNK